MGNLGNTRRGAYISVMLDLSRFVTVVVPLLVVQPSGLLQGVCDRSDLKCRLEHLNDILDGIQKCYSSDATIRFEGSPPKDMSLAADLRGTATMTATLS